MCELCKIWFYCKCQDVTEDTCKLLNQERIHLYCGRCDRAVGKILETLAELHLREAKLQVNMKEMEEGLHQVRGDVWEYQQKME
jgi:hypothetical protein